MTSTGRSTYQRIDPDLKDAYVEAHENVPDGVTEGWGGATNFELYVRDDIAVCLLECENLDAYKEAVTADEAVEEWERNVSQFKFDEVDVDAPEGELIPFMERIWRHGE